MSEYFKNLSKNAKRLYEEKIIAIGLDDVEKYDPFLNTMDWKDDVSKWPEVEFGQIYVYLIDSPGPYTRENMKAYRSLEAYQQFYFGWVRTCFVWEVNDTILLKAKVTRSQAVTDVPHEAWCALDKNDSTILTGHCTCMAGQGEMCSHVAALLFKVEACTRLGFNKVSCTSVPCKWNQNYTKKVEAATIHEISFRKPKRENFHQQSQERPVENRQEEFADISSFLLKLRQTNKNAVIFSVTNPKPQPKVLGSSLPNILTHLYSTDNVILSADELNRKCVTIFDSLSVTSSQAEKVEAMTRQQSNCSLWFQFRKGRLTASNFHEIIHSDINICSSVSLLKKIMNYSSLVKTSATEWGLKSEQSAIDQYRNALSKDHKNFKVRKCGLIISQNYPYLAATPDAVVSCDCCGIGVLEVKCPFKYKDFHPCEIDSSEFFLLNHTQNNTCNGSLKTNHKHFCQVQGQINLAQSSYCDFVVWTKKGLHVERIKSNALFFNDMLDKLKKYFLNIVLPELLTNRLKSEIEGSKKSTSYCFCGEDESYDNMIACDSKTCPKEWYHLSCVGLKETPTDKWFCLSCKHTRKRKK